MSNKKVIAHIYDWNPTSGCIIPHIVYLYGGEINYDFYDEKNINHSSKLMLDECKLYLDIRDFNDTDDLIHTTNGHPVIHQTDEFVFYKYGNEIGVEYIHYIEFDFVSYNLNKLSTL